VSIEGRLCNGPQCVSAGLPTDRRLSDTLSKASGCVRGLGRWERRPPLNLLNEDPAPERLGTSTMAKISFVRSSFGHAHLPSHPPSIARIWPCTYWLASEQRNTAAPATSLGVPHRPAGIRSSICRLRVSSRRRASVLSVAMYPGAIAFTLILFEAHSLARAFVSCAKPRLAAA
jgi:hypothetical protein